MKNIWSNMRFLGDETIDDEEQLSGLELSRLHYLAEHPELEDPTIGSLPE